MKKEGLGRVRSWAGLGMKGLEGTGISEKGRIRKSKKLDWTNIQGNGLQ